MWGQTWTNPGQHLCLVTMACISLSLHRVSITVSYYKYQPHLTSPPIYEIFQLSREQTGGSQARLEQQGKCLTLLTLCRKDTRVGLVTFLVSWHIWVLARGRRRRNNMSLVNILYYVTTGHSGWAEL